MRALMTMFAQSFTGRAPGSVYTRVVLVAAVGEVLLLYRTVSTSCAPFTDNVISGCPLGPAWCHCAITDSSGTVVQPGRCRPKVDQNVSPTGSPPVPPGGQPTTQLGDVEWMGSR